MFKARITKKITPARAVGKALEAAQRTALAHLVQSLFEGVLKRIPNKGGWYAVYRNSLRIETVSERPLTLTILTDTDTDLSRVPAEETAVFVEGDDAVASILRVFNPWPVDMLPAIYGGAPSTLRLAPANPKELVKRREQLVKEGAPAAVKERLSAAGFVLASDSVPSFSGRTYFDFEFMTKRLEFGLGPFPPTPHWRPALKSFEGSTDRILRGAATEIKAAMERRL